MPAKPKFIVGVVEQILAPAAPLSSVAPPLSRPGISLTGDQLAYFDPADLPVVGVQLRFLYTLQAIRWPVHIELRSNDVIAAVRIPEVGRVVSISRGLEGVYEVALDSVEARFLIDPAADPESFEVFKRALGTEDLVVVADQENDWVLDAQRLPALILLRIPPYMEVSNGTPVIESTSILESVAAVDNLFVEMQTLTCPLPNPPEDCIPFLYAPRGCWARAHRMCQRLAERTPPVVAAKLWLFGRLRVDTSNVAECNVNWIWHTAPFVRVQHADGPVLRVLDPSIFEHGSVSVEDWIATQHDKSATLAHAEASVFMLAGPGVGRLETPCAPGTLCETDIHLRRYRRRLLEIAPGKPKPPPFDQCQI